MPETLQARHLPSKFLWKPICHYKQQDRGKELRFKHEIMNLNQAQSPGLTGPHNNPTSTFNSFSLITSVWLVIFRECDSCEKGGKQDTIQIIQLTYMYVDYRHKSQSSTPSWVKFEWTWNAISQIWVKFESNYKATSKFPTYVTQEKILP